MLDLILSCVALVSVAPVMLTIAALIRFSSKGPILFRQKRMGREGELFTICKFRTMEVRSVDGPSLTRTGDQRVTPIGSVLRKYKLDELPQLYNVLVGDMSIVGPRPKLPHLEIMHMPFRPGLTGAATLAFRREEEMLQHIPDHELEIFYSHTIKPLKARLDWAYMEQSTMKTDLMLILHTVVACLGMRKDDLPDVAPPLRTEDVPNKIVGR